MIYLQAGSNNLTVYIALHHRNCRSDLTILELDKLLTLVKNKDGELLLSLASSDYSIKPSEETLDSIERDLSAQIEEDTYPHDSTIWCEHILKNIQKARKKKRQVS